MKKIKFFSVPKTNLIIFNENIFKIQKSVE